MADLVLATAPNMHAIVHEIDATNAMRALLGGAEIAKRAGFRALEIELPHLEPFFDQLGDGFWDDALGNLREMDMQISSAHGPIYPSLEIDLKTANKLLARYANAVTRLGIKAMAIHPTHHTHPHVCTIMPKLLERDIAVSTTTAEALSDGPCLLAIENLPTYSIRYLELLIRKLEGIDNIGITFDTGHWNIRPEMPLDEIFASFNNRIAHIHLTDNNGLCDQHLGPGMGNFPWQKLVELVPADQLTRPLMIELNSALLMTDPNAAETQFKLQKEAFNSASKILTPLINKRLESIHAN
ncbi:sugar phosphate isomerase/epimerase family protein [Poriferisphaera sp. WC338]|uniref:sugar phosphate isomerase/epimerase family protein n=1 Tax=Poriferisphaera sp. WC338 TaxID=3425129 RepID=UPI003D819A60